MERFGSAVDAFARLVCDTSRFNGEHSDGADEGVGEGGAYAHGEQVRPHILQVLCSWSFVTT